MATTKFETKKQVLQYLKKLPDEDVIYYGNFIIGLANRPTTNDEIAHIKAEHREELRKKLTEIQEITKANERLEQLIEKTKEYEKTLLDITKNEAMMAKEEVLEAKNDQLQMMGQQIKRGIEEQKAALQGQTKEIHDQTNKIANLEATINKFAGTRQKSATRGQQGEEFLENILSQSGAFEVVDNKTKEKNKGDFLVRLPRSRVEIMFESKDVSQKVKKSEKDRFQKDLDNNSYDCGVLVSLSDAVDSSIDDFVINKSTTKGKPFLYISNLRSYQEPHIILKVACLALIYSVEKSSKNEENPTKSFIAGQLQTFAALHKNSKDIKKQAEQLQTNAEENNKLVEKIYHGFQKLQREIEEPAPSEPQAGSKRPRNEDDIENN
eukprot:Seg633.11 transcript_id=Seg633.11/GoldUCD/mRNA.D3Y31 product="hypothetical protein" protein_id=Seg633.11/GoldUCD/D3Y31